jgi:hypothetical protein
VPLLKLHPVHDWASQAADSCYLASMARRRDRASTSGSTICASIDRQCVRSIV